MDEINWFGIQRVPILGISVQQLILILYPSLLIPVFLLWLQQLRRSKRARLSPAGYRKLGLEGTSNLQDECEEQYTIETRSKKKTPKWKLKALWVYPIKSCAGVELDVADIDGAGMLWDRKFGFAEWLTPPAKAGAPAPRPEWTFRTLRQPGYEKLALVRPEIWLKESMIDRNRRGVEGDNGLLIVKYPYIPSGPLAAVDRLMISLGFMSDESSFQVPLVPSEDHGYRAEEVTIWKDSPNWLNYGKHLPDELRQYLGVKNPVTLFRVDPQSYRKVFRCAPKEEDVGYQPIVGFADAYPLHLLNLASVRDIAEKVKDSNPPIPKFTARRFRANFIVTGGSQYDEDNWKRVRIGKHEMYCACHTIRCRLPNVDPDTAFRHPAEPDKTLKSIRCIDPGDTLNAALGLQLVPATNDVIQVKVGDEVEVLERGEHCYLKQ